MNKKQTIVISGFPGIGKSNLYDRGWDALDSDSSHFSWVKDSDGKNTKERHPDFPNNYMEHIKNNLGKYDYIFVSSHENVRDALKENHINYFNVFPDYHLKYEYLKRYELRGSPEPFIELMDKQYDNFVKGMYKDTNLNKVILKEEGKYLEDALYSLEKLNNL